MDQEKPQGVSSDLSAAKRETRQKLGESSATFSETSPKGLEIERRQKPVLRDRLVCAFRWFRPNAIWIWPSMIFFSALLYVLFVVRPFASNAHVVNSDVAISWNTSVSSLGISPIYPPQEDLYVGDLWVTITKAPDPSTVGRGLRIAHVDLSEAIKKVYTDESAEQKLFENDAIGPSDGKPHLFALAFPGILVSQTGSDSSNPTLPFLSIGSARNNNVTDEIKIPTAKTYGADIVQALITFYSFCEKKETEIYCTDSFARNILASTIDSNIVNDKQKPLKYEIKLHLITRIYLSSAISHRRIIGDAVSLSGKFDQTVTANKSENTTAPHTEVVTHVSSSSNSLIFDEKFEKPLVFGFRSVAFTPK